jgi:hypothetical protein
MPVLSRNDIRFLWKEGTLKEIYINSMSGDRMNLSDLLIL